MLKPIDFSRFETALLSTAGLLELLIVIACISVAWIFDRRLERHSRADGKASHTRLSGGVARAVFSLVAIGLLLLARVGFRQAGGAPFFIDLALPLLVALALIRMLLYATRNLFAEQAWLKTSEWAIAFAIWGMVILFYIGVLPEVARELDEIVLPIGRSSVSLLTIVKGLFAMVVTLVFALWLSSLVELRFLNATSLDTNTKAVLAKFIRAILLIVGLLMGLQFIGFDLTLLSVFGGALGVGIGLGLQKLAANYIAGFTILLDKSIRLGDLITVDGRYGVVAGVTSRYVVVRSLDGVDAIVPNETLVITTVLNHSSTSRHQRVGIALVVAPNTDLDRAMAIMVEAGREESRVMLTGPNAPTAVVLGLVEFGVNLELVLWLKDPENGQGVLRSTVNRRIIAAFGAAGIELAFPRRDLRPGGGPATGGATSGGTANAGRV